MIYNQAFNYAAKQTEYNKACITGINVNPKVADKIGGCKVTSNGHDGWVFPAVLVPGVREMIQKRYRDKGKDTPENSEIVSYLHEGFMSGVILRGDSAIVDTVNKLVQDFEDTLL